MRSYLLFGLLLCCIVSVLSKTVKKGCREKFKGCTIKDGDCVCGIDHGCRSPWPYLSIRECQKELRGENDRCLKSPCWHGKCVQVRLPRKRPYRQWECACSGSGYHGKKCHLKCPPSDKSAPLPRKFPDDCIY